MFCRQIGKVHAPSYHVEGKKIAATRPGAGGRVVLRVGKPLTLIDHTGLKNTGRVARAGFYSQPAGIGAAAACIRGFDPGLHYVNVNKLLHFACQQRQRG